MTKRQPSAREGAVLFHLLSGDDPLTVALRDQVDHVLVVEGGPIQPCCASRYIWADVPGADEQLTGGHFHVVEAAWRESPEILVRLWITVSGHLTHLEITHDHERELGPMEFPPPDELQEPAWWELDPSPAPPWEWTRRRRGESSN
jgi:hypothetical protein